VLFNSTDPCELIGAQGFSFQQYAEDENLSKEDLVSTLTPICYSCGVACTMTAGSIMGGSNLSKYMYHQNVMSRKEELKGLASGESPAEMRRDALTKKVRGQREGDIAMASGEMQKVRIDKLEEEAMMMEVRQPGTFVPMWPCRAAGTTLCNATQTHPQFATGVSMERHYNLVAHDDVVESIKKAAAVEENAGDPARGLEPFDGDGEEGDEVRRHSASPPPSRSAKGRPAPGALA
jgi:hypothetical protein